MKLTRKQLGQFAKGYQAQHDDMFADLKEHFSDIQGVMLDTDIKTIMDFEDFGRQAFLYKLKQYIKQVKLLREAQGLPNLKYKS